MQSDSDSFKFQNGILYCEGISIDELISSIPVSNLTFDINGRVINLEVPSTPIFVYSSSALKRNVTNYLNAMKDAKLNGRLGYAVKANGNHGILQSLKSYGVEMLVTVSGNEILAGLKAGFTPENIILNGNGKQEWEIKLAIELGVILNVDSIFDSKRIAEMHKKYFPRVEVKVLLRIRPSVPVHLQGSSVHPYVNTAEASKFGFSMADLDSVLEILEREGNIDVHGIHCHLGSCIYDPAVYQSVGEIMTDMTNELRQRGYSIEILDIGGGIGIDYHLNIPGLEPFLDVKETKNNPAELSQFINIISSKLPKGITVILEPGRSLVGNAGILACKVLGSKEAGQKRFAVVDGSMAEVIRPCLYGSYHKIYPTKLQKTTPWLPYEVVGPICETADFLGHDIPLQMPSDYLAIMDVGAYCSSMSSNYNMRPRPYEILVNRCSWKYIRQRETFDDFMLKM